MLKYIIRPTRLLFLVLSLSTILSAAASVAPKDEYYLSGIVRDSLTLEPLPFASVTVAGHTIGALANNQGIFELTVPTDASQLVVTCLGYDKKVVNIHKGYINLYDVQMTPSTTELQELVVRRPKYSKKNNPAVQFLQSLRQSSRLTDPLRHDYYNYDKHEIFTLALNDFTARDESSWLFRKFPFLWEHVDTSEISGKPILNVMVKEKSSTVHYRRSPSTMREITLGLRQEGIDEIVDQGSMQTFINDVLREIDLYENDINLLQNRFVSPLSRIAPDFYKFYLTDTVDVGDERCIVLSFYPHNHAAFGFTGQVFVPVNDSTMFIKKVTMRTPRNINLNFVENLYLTQEYDRAPDGSRLKKRDDLIIEASVIPGKPSFYVRRNVAYDGHTFDAPADMSVFNISAAEVLSDSVYARDSVFWDRARMLNVTGNEQGVANLMTRLRSVPVFYYTEKFLKIMFTGYINTAKDSKFDYGPVNTSVSLNSIEGVRLRTGGVTTGNLSRRWFGRGYAAYGTRDHRWKYGAELEYSFRDKKYHSREFPIHSLRLTSLYDLDHIGQHYLFTNSDNVFLSLKRMSDYHVTYHNLNKLEYTLELPNHLSVHTELANHRQFATRWLPFVDGYGNDIGHFTENYISLQLRYAPGEKFYQSRSSRMPINMDNPVFTLTHTFAPKGFLGSRYMVNKTEGSVSKRFWLSAFGYLDAMVLGGHVWSRSPFINLMIPNANLSYTIQPESYALMNPMEFVNDSYCSWFVSYWFNGLIFNNVPLIKKLKLREVVSFSGLYGHLSRHNDPDFNPELLRFPADAHVTRMSGRPYMEISAGLDNIFKCLRVDYVWRLSYLDVPYPIDRRGLRLALHVTF